MTIARDLIDLRVQLQGINQKRRDLIETTLKTIRQHADGIYKEWLHPADREVRVEELQDAIYESAIRQHLGGDVYVYEVGDDRINVEFDEWETSHC